MNPRDYPHYDDATQPLRTIERYPKSFTRTPSAALVERPLTLSERTGPTGLAARFGIGHLDLARATTTSGRATGQLIEVSGRLLDEDGSPLAGAVIELWQANAAGRYIHEMDTHPAPLDPNFTGVGRCITGPDGSYRFVTIKPGAYPWKNHLNAWRPAHIHFSLFGTEFTQRIVTQMYFPGDQLFPLDPIYQSIVDQDARDRLVATYNHEQTKPEWALAYNWDIVLTGSKRTWTENEALGAEGDDHE